VHSIIDDSTEAVIQRMIEANRRFIREDNRNSNDNDNRSSSSRQDGEQKKKKQHSSGGGEEEEGIPTTIMINPATRAHFQLEIETLQNAPRDASKLEQIIKAKEREHDKARHIYETQRLVTEIEMLKFVLFLVNRNTSRRS
jgi:hypothetical protein